MFQVIINKLYFILCDISENSDPFTYFKDTTVEDPSGGYVTGIFQSAAFTLKTIGILGAVITILISIILHMVTRKAAVKSEQKDKIVHIIFLLAAISMFTFILGLIKGIADDMIGV